MALNTTYANLAKVALLAEMKNKKQPVRLLPFYMQQLAHETAGFNSRVSKVNNLSGIKYNKNGFAKDSGIESPEGNNYAAYDNLSLWAKDFLRIIERMGADKAQTIGEFSRILKSKGYYTDKEANYTKALNSWGPQMSKIIADIGKFIAVESLDDVEKIVIKTATICILLFIFKQA